MGDCSGGYSTLARIRASSQTTTAIMYSGHMEAFGLLTAISFLQYYLSCYQPLLSATTVPCFCDNLGVITMLTTLQTTTSVRPNDTTNDDCNIYLAIHEAATQCLFIKFQYWHVKGHQDKDPKNHLTIAEQHNVDCDKLAKIFVSDHPFCSTAMATPEFTVALTYWDYLSKQFTWTHSNLMAIQWDTLKTSLNSFLCNDQCQLVLFIHNKLALCTSKFHPHLGSQLCPSCQCNPEDIWHFFECQYPDCCHLFSNLKQSLVAITTKYSLHPAILTTTFWLGLLTI